MITRNEGNKDLKELVYNKSRAAPLDATAVPTLVNEAVMSILQNGDTEPYYKIEAIDYPVEGSGGTYTKEFFKSFIDVMKNRPIPGSKRGHEYQSRPNTDFYTVGGKMVENADGKTGTAYMKIYIPPRGDTTDNAGFIRDAKANIVHFSLVTVPNRIVKRDAKGEEQNFFISSNGLERNDAVEFGAGAMEQEVNSSATSAADRTKNGGTMDKNEVLAVVKNLMANGQTSLIEIARNSGVEKLVRTEQDEQNAVTVATLNSKLGDKPFEKLDAILAENAANAESIVENKIAVIAGPRLENNAEGKPVENAAHRYAKTLCNGKSGEALDAAIAALKDDPVLVALNARRADHESELNRSTKAKSDSNKPGAVPVLNV